MELQKDIDDLQEEIKKASYFPLVEDIVNIIEKKTGNNSHTYFRVVTSFFLAQIASCMRCQIKGETFDNVPVNMYVCGLMPSGAGKGHSLGILEDMVINNFKDLFTNITLPQALETNLNDLATKYAQFSNKSTDSVLKELTKESLELGPLPYSFDSGTGAAFKQVRAKAQLCNCGALSFVCDEIGSNLSNNSEVTAMGLEVFDKGKIKAKITKNSADNKRQSDRDTPVPCNMLWFGTPAKLLDGGKEEDNFYDLLKEGYARRMFFAEGQKETSRYKSGKELRDSLLASNFEQKLEDISEQLGKLSSLSELGKTLLLDADEEILILNYKTYCEQRADKLPAHDEIKKAELSNRWWKALKLAGAYTFIEGNLVVDRAYILAAIKLAEDSGESFLKILARDKTYVRLAKYLGEINKPITQADLSEELPFFKGPANARQDMLNLASAWGFQNGIVIKTFEVNKIQFIEGNKLQNTDLDHIIFSISNDIAYQYENQDLPWDKLNKLGTVDGLHWCTHHFMQDPMHPEQGNKRSKDFVLPEFNLVVLDVDQGTSLEFAQEVLQDYTYMIYTTKSHTATNHCFRIILPMKYKLYLNAEDYSAFMKNIYEELPFTLDEQTKDIARKWLTNNGTVITNTGELFDPRMYIPNTSKNQDRQENYKKYGDTDAVTRWFLQKIQPGNRNAMLFKYGMLLKDQKKGIDEIKSKVLDLNSKLKNPLSLAELTKTVFTSIEAKS